MRLEEVEWVDSWLSGKGWEPVSSARVMGDKIKCRSAGYVLNDTKRGVVLASSLSYNNAAGTVFIPRRAITKRKRLR